MEKKYSYDELLNKVEESDRLKSAFLANFYSRLNTETKTTRDEK